MSARVTKSLVLFVLLLIFAYLAFGAETKDVSGIVSIDDPLYDCRTTPLRLAETH